SPFRTAPEGLRFGNDLGLLKLILNAVWTACRKMPITFRKSFEFNRLRELSSRQLMKWNAERFFLLLHFYLLHYVKSSSGRWHHASFNGRILHDTRRRISHRKSGLFYPFGRL